MQRGVNLQVFIVFVDIFYASGYMHTFRLYYYYVVHRPVAQLVGWQHHRLFPAFRLNQSKIISSLN
jgi:hypothetical protein